MSRTDARSTVWGQIHVYKIRDGEFCLWEPPLHEWKRAVELNLLHPDMPFPKKREKMLRGSQENEVLKKCLVLRASVDDVLNELEWLCLDQQPYHAIIAAACVAERRQKTPIGVLAEQVIRILRSTLIIWGQVEPSVPNPLRIEDWRMRRNAAKFGPSNFLDWTQHMSSAVEFIMRYWETVRDILPRLQPQWPNEVQDLKEILSVWEAQSEEERRHIVFLLAPKGERLGLIAESARNLQKVQKE